MKRLDSAYEPGARPGSWLKIKNQLSQEVVVAGWKPGQGNRTGLVGSLLVGVHSSSGALLYAGHVGTGFSDAMLRMLTRRLDRCADRTSRSTARCLPSMRGPQFG